MRLRWAYLLVLALMALLVAPAAAQSAKLVYEDQGCSLDRARIESAAQPLIERGALVAVVCTDDAGGDARRYLGQQLQSLGVSSSSSTSDLASNAIVYFVSLSPRDSAVLAGAGWEALGERALEDLRLNSLNPQLKASNFTAAFANALSDTGNVISSRGTGGGTTVVETQGIATWLWACLIVVVLGVLAALLVPPFLRRRRKTQAAQTAFTQARDRFEGARRAAGGAIADLGRLVEDARLKQRFDVASYGEEPAAEFAEQQQQVDQLFNHAQHEFDETEERIQLLQQPAAEDYQSAAAAYEDVRETAARVHELLQQLDARREELDRVNRKAAGEIDGLKKG